MRIGTLCGAIRIVLLLFCLATVSVIAGPTRAGAAVSMRNYCSVPPLPGFTVKPNLLLMVDNSASMYDLAYTDPANYCVDDSADTYDKSSEPYPGYFDPGTFYSYTFKTDSKKNEIGFFEPIAGAEIAESSKCNAVDKDYVCVNITGKKADNFIARGNFLNWLATSKLDMEKKVLTGGKYDPATQLLQGETRGCQGKRFIKMVGDEPITFAVRGPVPAEPDFLYQASQGGMTRIEIYSKKYNKDACLAAVAAWQAGSVDALVKQSALCMDQEYESDGTPTKGKIYTEIMSGCYSFLAGTSGALDAVLPQLIKDCTTRMLNRYGDNPTQIRKYEGDQVCGRGVYHPIYSGSTSSNGYLGQCYSIGGAGYEATCAAWQAKDYCRELETPALTDPSATANLAGTSANVPGFVLEAGVYSLGEVKGTVLARTQLAAPPSGLIQEYSDHISLGAMVFNSDGAGSECGAASGILCVRHCQNHPVPRRQCYQESDCKVSGKVTPPGSCAPDAKLDGGRVISYLNNVTIGDHSADSGLVAAVDAIRADSWTPLSEAFYEAMGYFAGRSDLRLQEADFDTASPPSKFSCQRNNVLLITDGMSSADRNSKVNDFVAAGVAAWVNDFTNPTGEMPASLTTTNGNAVTAAPTFSGSYNLDDLAWIARKKNLFDPAQPATSHRDYLTTHVVYTGVPCAKAVGGCLPDERDPEKLMQLTATKGGGVMAAAQNPAEWGKAIRGIFQKVQEEANAGTDASILSTGQGNAALYLQEHFYPGKSFDGGATWATWMGEMQSLWYFIDPFIGTSGGASAIREDTGGFKTLDLTRDRVVRYVFDPQSKQTVAMLYQDLNGDGDVDVPQSVGYPKSVAPEAVQSLWRAGLQLWKKEASTRTIYTQTDGHNLVGLASNGTSLPVLDPSKATNQKLLQAASEAEAKSIVSFVQGADSAGSRDRTLDIGGESRVWKLGDIVSSTPVLQSAVSLGNYHLATGYGDKSYGEFVGSAAYENRGTVYVGANDGMLHAFKLGVLKQHPEGTDTWPVTQKAALEGDAVGEEAWAYVPNSALPYLRYLKEPLYSHLYYVDGSSTIADVSIGDPDTCSANNYWNCPKNGTSWRTVLIGGMGLGGASRESGATCTDKAGIETCVKSPLPDGGLSSYFALDVTKPATPRLLWEFSHPLLGFATSGAAIVKINAQSGQPPSDDEGKNGRWFAVFASGPTGPLDQDARQFLGRSDQNLRLFVVDLNPSPPLTQGKNYWIIETGIENAFGGSMHRAAIDTDRWNPNSKGYYEDDALYLGYSQQLQNGSWSGGVLRLLTGENLDPAQWKASKVIDGIGPVTGGVAKLQDRQQHKLWLHFGTGRFLHNQDDLAAPRALFGVMEPCYPGKNDPRGIVDILPGKDILSGTDTCSGTPLNLADLKDMTQDAQGVLPEDAEGWWIGLDGAGGSRGSERFTSQPASLTTGAVFFTTFKPSTDVCADSISYLWGVKHDNGGVAPQSLLGKALVPLSNGSSAEFSLSGLSERNGRRSAGVAGKPGGVKLITNSGLKPLKKIIHIQER